MALSKIQAESMNLADTYAFTGTVSGAGAMELISSDNTGATSVTSADITLSQSTDYHHQILVVNGIYNSAAVDTFWYMIEGGSVVNSTNAYGFQYISRKNGVSTEGGSSNGSTAMRLNWYAIGNDVSEPCDMYIKIFNSNTASLRTAMEGTLNGKSSANDMLSTYFNTQRLATTVCEGLRMSVSSGDFSYAGHALYGVKL